MVIARRDPAPDQTVTHHELEKVDGRRVPAADVGGAVDPRPVGEDHEISLLEKLDRLLMFPASEDKCPSCSPFASGEDKGLHGAIIKEVRLLVRRGRLALLCRNQQRRRTNGFRIVVLPVSQYPADSIEVDRLVSEERSQSEGGSRSP